MSLPVPKPSPDVRRGLPAAVLCALLAGPALGADEADALNVYISQSFQRDDNIFRLPDGVHPSALGSDQRSDVISVTSLSAVFDRTYSLQRLRATADYARIAFDHWDRLDYSTKGAALRWDWALGKRWTGVLRAEQDETARDFADITRARAESSINRQRSAEFGADYWWHPDWSGGVGFERFSSAYSDEASDASDYEANISEARLTYRPRSGSTVSLVGRFTDGEYPNRSSSAFSDSGFRQTDWRVRAYWKASGHSELKGYVGLTRRRHPNLDNRDFTGPTARLEYDWAPTGKLSLNAVARREIGARDDLVDNFVVTRAFSLAPTWAATARIAVQGRWEWRKRDYRGDPGLVPGLAVERDDITRTAGLSVIYTPIDPLQLSVSYSHQTRDSESPTSEYSADTAAVTVQYGF